MTIAILAPGQMGASLGTLIGSRSSVRVVTTLHDRSARTKRLAQQAKIHDLGSYDAVIKQSNIILSVLPPSNAVSMAQQVIEAVKNDESKDSKTIHYIDMNAISPRTSTKISTMFEHLPRVRYIDGGIIGGPATLESCPKIVLSGEAVNDVFQTLSELFLNRVTNVGDKIGAASALKLSYASLAKGMIALTLNAGLLAKQYDVLNALQEELEESNKAAAQTLQTRVPRNVAKAYRWIGEMDEIATSFNDVGLVGGATAFQGISQTYDLVAKSKEIGSESIEESLERGRSIQEVLTALEAEFKVTNER
ncbi:hypothetical protein OIO90_006218 [Microbotryomycetes sp. JL221]|nr:hypothetical protein OIO90_006218 [Microbotryomycetes sp. JL221]